VLCWSLVFAKISSVKRISACADVNIWILVWSSWRWQCDSASCFWRNCEAGRVVTTQGWEWYTIARIYISLHNNINIHQHNKYKIRCKLMDWAPPVKLVIRSRIPIAPHVSWKMTLLKYAKLIYDNWSIPCIVEWHRGILLQLMNQQLDMKLLLLYDRSYISRCNCWYAVNRINKWWQLVDAVCFTFYRSFVSHILCLW